MEKYLKPTDRHDPSPARPRVRRKRQARIPDLKRVGSRDAVNKQKQRLGGTREEQLAALAALQRMLVNEELLHATRIRQEVAKLCRHDADPEVRDRARALLNGWKNSVDNSDS